MQLMTKVPHYHRKEIAESLKTQRQKWRYTLKIYRPELPELSVSLKPHDYWIGRDNACDIVLKDSKISRQHARLEWLPEYFWRIHDHESQNGILVQGLPVKTMILFHGDEITVGDAKLQLYINT
jgi:pSer/pThr/pTyr-binding forkhead associated (FHA) protein